MVAGIPITLFAAKKALAVAPDRGFALVAMGLAALEVIGLVGMAAFVLMGG